MTLSEIVPKGFRSGFAALIGRPNVGKSTLLNQLVGEKIAITSPVAQTTRNRLKAILTTSEAQLIIVDTPGIHKPHHLLGEKLVQSARKSIGEVDLVVLMFDASTPPGKGDSFIVELLRQQKIPVVIALNKCDLVSEEIFHERVNQYEIMVATTSWPINCCSAMSGEGCKRLIDGLIACLPEGPQLYPSEMVSDQPEKIILAELIREQVIMHTREEVPHSVAVQIERIDEISIRGSKSTKNFRTAILATVLVERKSQKGILIGKNGNMLKIIGSGARRQMQKLIDGQVYLELFVKVVPDWRSKPSRLAELGYEGK